jgi:SAM-dependent methyltransferase
MGTAAREWERLWAPYDELTYEAVLAHVQPDDIVLDIGAGDLRLAYRLANQVRRVYAVEINQALVPLASSVPDNLDVVCADAYQLEFPNGITTAVLLMRHCQQFGLLFEKLVAAGCRRLITNARWRTGVELIDLRSSRIPYSAVSMGWYACGCGATGFVPGSPERLTAELEITVYEVKDCPVC